MPMLGFGTSNLTLGSADKIAGTAFNPHCRKLEILSENSFWGTFFSLEDVVVGAGTAVQQARLPLRRLQPLPACLVQALDPLHSSASFRLMHLPGGSTGQPKYVGFCHPHKRPEGTPGSWAHPDLAQDSDASTLHCMML